MWFEKFIFMSHGLVDYVILRLDNDAIHSTVNKTVWLKLTWIMYFCTLHNQVETGHTSTQPENQILSIKTASITYFYSSQINT